MMFYLPIIFLFLAYPSVAQPASPPPLPAVLSYQGKPMTTGNCAFIKPAHVLEGGGFGIRGSLLNVNGSSMFPNGTSSFCPPCAVAESISRLGLCLFFYPVVKPEDGIIRVSTDLNIEFGFPETCGQPVVWRLKKILGTKYVNLGGEIGNPGPETVDNWFKIKSIVGDEFRYKIVHCPGELVCPPPCKVKCKDVGVVMQNGKSRLALAKKSYNIIFTF